LIECSHSIQIGAEVKVLLSTAMGEDEIPIIGKVVRIAAKSADGDNRFGIQLVPEAESSETWESLFADVGLI
jgi:hypothetical protein